MWEAMASLGPLPVYLGEGGRSGSASRGNDGQPGLRSGSENNVSIAPPSSATPAIVYTSEGHGGTATDGNDLELLAREKSHALPVGREEWVGGAFRAGDRLSLPAVHLPQVQLLA